MKSRTKSNLSFFRLDPADFERVNESLNALANDPKQLRHYRLLSKTPLFYLTSLGGWSFSRTVISILSILVSLTVPVFRLDAICVFMLVLLQSFGHRSYVDSMIRLHILRRLRSDPDRLTSLEAEPLVALFGYLKDSVGRRSLARYKKKAERFLLAKEIVYYASISFLLVFVGSVSLLIAALFVAVPYWWGSAILASGYLGLYGIGGTMIAMFVTLFLDNRMRETEKPVFIGEDELSVIAPQNAPQPLQLDEGAPSPFRVSGSSGESSAHWLVFAHGFIYERIPDTSFFYPCGLSSTSLSISRCSSASPLCLTSFLR